MKTHPAVLAVTSIILSVLVSLLLIEIGLRFFPVQSYMPLRPVTQEDPVLRFKPNHNFVFSSGWDFDAYATGHINAQGWVHDRDYIRGNKPVLAVIGDSYIQARMVTHDQTVQGILDKDMPSIDVFSFGIGGAPMSQYLIFARHARDLYQPDFMVFNIVSNDFDESLPQYKNMPRFHYFVEDDMGHISPQLIGTYTPSKIKEIMSHSALVRYLYFHLNLANAYNRFLFKKRGGDTHYVGNVEAKVSEQKILDSQNAVRTFLQLLPDYSGLQKNKIVLVMDGIRSDIYNDTESGGSYFARMRAFTIHEASARGYTIIDMHPVFKRHYEEHGQRFEFTRDAHWNALAHTLAADEIGKSAPFKAFIAN